MTQASNPHNSPSGDAVKVVSGLGDAVSVHAKPASALPVLELDARTYDRALDCIHCGLCLPACPTYTENGLEGDSPRGRIYLMKSLADGRIDATKAVVRHLDLCLDCRACETACPSGVVYHELIEETRARLRKQARPSLGDRLIQAMCRHIFPYPTRLKLAMLGPRLLQLVGLWKPLVRLARPSARLDKLMRMAPAQGPMWPSRLASRYGNDAANHQSKAIVGFFPGCIGSVLFHDVNRQSVALLRRAGCEVRVPDAQRCCGAIHHHSGHPQQATDFARANIDAFLPQPPGGPSVDMIVANVAGCGAMLKDYAHLLRDDPAYRQRAIDFVAKVRDITEALVELKLPPGSMDVNLTATYHDACHLAHAQGVVEPPRQLLASIKGLTLIPLPESDMCCGAAGTYNLTEPEMAGQLGERKIRHIQATGATHCVTGNAGCAMQIQSEADRLGVPLTVVHPVTLLYQAQFG
ncbi:MAG: heterodisulfide reductase-related iron-sulfur binding cluster [Phycisphaeraceae bacterium]